MIATKATLGFANAAGAVCARITELRALAKILRNGRIVRLSIFNKLLIALGLRIDFRARVHPEGPLPENFRLGFY